MNYKYIDPYKNIEDEEKQERKEKIIGLTVCIIAIIILVIINSNISNEAVKHCINEGQDPKICEQLRD